MLLINKIILLSCTIYNEIMMYFIENHQSTGAMSAINMDYLKTKS